MSELPFTALDIGIFLVLAISALLAFVRGFVHEVLAVARWIGAILAVVFGLPYVRPFAQKLISHQPLVADVAAAAVIFIVTLIVLSLLTGSLSQRVRDSALGALDRSLGFVFGLARGAVLVCLAYLSLEWAMPPAEQPDWIRGARSMPFVERGAEWLKSLAPAHTQQAGARAGDQARERARRALETSRMVRDMMSPEPKGPPAGIESGGEGYGERERREMERLLDAGR